MGSVRLFAGVAALAVTAATVGTGPAAVAAPVPPAPTRAVADLPYGTIYMLSNLSSQTLTGFAYNWGAITLAPGVVNYPVDTDELGSAGIGGANGPGMQIMYLPNNEDAASPYLECNPQNLGSPPELIIQFINIDNSPYMLACQASDYPNAAIRGDRAFAHVRFRSNAAKVRRGVATIKVASYSNGAVSSERVTLRNPRGRRIGTRTKVIKTNRSASIKVRINAATRRKIRRDGSATVRVAVTHAFGGSGQRLKWFILTR